MNDAHHGEAWGTPKIGMSYRDGEGRQFLVFSLTADYIYLEYGSGEIQTLCHAEWPRLEPRPVSASATWDNAPTAAWAAA